VNVVLNKFPKNKSDRCIKGMVDLMDCLASTKMRKARFKEKIKVKYNKNKKKINTAIMKNDCIL
jgi:hypothetical protein